MGATSALPRKRGVTLTTPVLPSRERFLNATLILNVHFFVTFARRVEMVLRTTFDWMLARPEAHAALFAPAGRAIVPVAVNLYGAVRSRFGDSFSLRDFGLM